jgi:dinuclear metal center YbgI/SA1388 family protein
MQLRELTAYLDDYLRIKEVPDWPDAYNGLEVEGRTEIKVVATAVDACQATIDEAISRGADLLLVHHGLFWGSKAPMTGILYRRISALIKANLPVYSSHLPLDVHPEVGNNHVLARKLELVADGQFAEYQGYVVGITCSCDLSRDEVVARLTDTLGVAPHVIPTGPERIRKIGIVTGGAGGWIGKAARAGCDLYITGEGQQHTYFDAEENGINVIYAGHYLTETVGVQALGQHLNDRFGLETFFIDHPTGL